MCHSSNNIGPAIGSENAPTIAGDKISTVEVKLILEQNSTETDNRVISSSAKNAKGISY